MIPTKFIMLLNHTIGHRFHPNSGSPTNAYCFPVNRESNCKANCESYGFHRYAYNTSAISLWNWTLQKREKVLT